MSVISAVIGGSADQIASAQSLTLAWDPSPDSFVAGYMVYVGTTSAEYTATFDVGFATSFVYGVVPEQPYFFAVASYANGPVVGPLSPEVTGSVPATVTLSNPGDQTSLIGEPLALQLVAADSFDQPVSFAAAGLPDGLHVDTHTGLISGTPTVAGAYAVSATASNGISAAQQNFTWIITPIPSDSSAIDVTPPVITITTPAVADVGVTSDGYVMIGGTAVDDVGVTAVTWITNRGEGGVATGTDHWMAEVFLQPGRNDITVFAVDDAGNHNTATLLIRQTLSK